MEKMEKVKKVITKMGMEDAVGHITALLNLMSLADVIPEGTTVYDTDTGDMLELVPMIREANDNLQWLLDRAFIGPNNGDNGSGDKASDFTEKFIGHVKEFDNASKVFDGAAKEFHDWLAGELDNVSVEDVTKALKCGDPAIGPIEKNLLRGILMAKRAANAGMDATIIGFSCN